MQTPNVVGSANVSSRHFLAFFLGVGTPNVVKYVGLYTCMGTAGLEQGHKFEGWFAFSGY